MRSRHIMPFVLSALLAWCLPVHGQVASKGSGQAYPAKPVRILVGFAPGGGTDIMARAVGAKMTESVKQQFIIENRPGANANVAAKLAAEAPADGYTILFMSVAHIMSKPVYKNLGYDIERDLAPITVVSEVSNVFAAHPTLPARNVKELIALARAKPGELTYATSGVASPEHFAGEMFKMMTRTNLLPIPYKGGGPIAIDLMAGHVMTSFSTMPPIIPHIRAGRVKALADPGVKDRLASLGADIVASSPEQTAAIFKADLAKYTKVAKAANIHVD